MFLNFTNKRFQCPSKNPSQSSFDVLINDTDILIKKKALSFLEKER